MSLHSLKISRIETSGISAATTAAAANPARQSYEIQNLGTNPLFVHEAAGASTTVFTRVLAAGTVNDNGTGAKYESPAEVAYTGVITIAGTSPRYVITQKFEV